MNFYIHDMQELLAHLLEIPNLQEKLSHLIRFLETHVQWNSLAFIAQDASHSGYRVTISREVSNRFVKQHRYQENDALIQQLKKGPLTFPQSEAFEWDTDFQQALLLPLTVNQNFYGFLILTTKQPEFAEDERKFAAVISQLASFVFHQDFLQDVCEQYQYVDRITHLPNYKAFFRDIDREFHHALRYQEPLGLALLKIQNYTQISEISGLLEVHHLMKELAQVSEKTLRNCDMVFRKDIDMLAILCPQSDQESVEIALQRILTNIEEMDVLQPAPVLRIGFSIFNGQDYMKNFEPLLVHAEKALYEALRHPHHPQIYFAPIER